MAGFCDYMVQHILYVSGVEKSIRQNMIFPHKEPTECAFGKLFYGTLKPDMDSYSVDKRQLLEQIEQTHSQFHATARNIHPDNPDMEQHQKDAWYYSSQLINMLNKLEGMRD